MVNHSKRGLSAIVATLIVVLLAIVAFGIISGFIQDVVTQRTSEADLASSNTRLNIQKASVEGNKSSVSVRRQGSGNLEVVGARVVFDSGDGRAVSSGNFTIGKQELSTFSIPLCSEEFSDVDFSSEDLSATVYPIVMYEGERTMLDGNPSSVDFVEVDGPELVENCNQTQSSESGSGSESGDGSGDSGSGTGDGSGSNDGGSDGSGSDDSGSGDGSGDSGSGGDSLPACTDSDGDGYVSESSGSSCDMSKVSASNYGDCNDNRADVNPGSQEVCGDNVDNDCDGDVDEGCGGFICDDGDNDGYVEDKDYLYCNTPTGDCNDSDPDINPGVSEVCGDNVDNDCDGDVDEGCGNQGATPGDRDGSEGGFVVEQPENMILQARFDSPDSPGEIPKQIALSNEGSSPITVQTEVSEEVSRFVEIREQVELPAGSSEEVNVLIMNPSESGRNIGSINLDSGEGTPKEINTEILVR